MLVAILLALAAAQPTEDLSLAVLPVIAGDAPIGAPGLRDRARAALVDRPNLRLLDADPFPSGLTERVNRCGVDTDCIASEFVGTPPALVLVLIVSALASPPLISARLLDVRSARLVTEHRDVEDWSALDRTIVEIVDASLDAFGHRRWARLTVLGRPGGARIDLGPVSYVARASGMLVPPGPVDVTVSAEGHKSKKVGLVLEPGERRSLEVALEEESSVLSSPWLWVGAGLAVVVGGAIITAAILIPNDDPSLCLTRSCGR